MDTLRIPMVALAALAGCASVPPAPPPDPSVMATILIYPITDARAKPEPKLSDCNLTRPFGEKFFYPVNGRIQNAADAGHLFDASASSVTGMPADQLKAIRRDREHYFLVTTVNRWEYDGASLEYEISSALVRADSGGVVWKRTNKDSKWLGIIGGAFDALAETVGPFRKCAYFFMEPLPKTFVQMPNLERY